MDFEKIEIITLKATPFKDRSKILQVFSKDHGLISLIVNNISLKNTHLSQLCTPFTISEIVTQKRKSEIFTLKEASIIEENLHLRKNLSFLKAAGKMTKSLLDSHFFHRNASNVFFLLKTYLKNVSINPDAIYISFLLKLLLNEGLINPQEKCNRCPSTASSFEKGEQLCLDHATEYAFRFGKDEFQTLLVLSLSRSFSILKDLGISNNFLEKTEFLFKELI